MLGVYDGAGNRIEELVWLDDIPVATIRTDTSGGVGFFYIHTDHLNTPVRLTRLEDNAVMWRWDHDPYGAGATDDDADDNGAFVFFNPRFPGQYQDVETTLHYNGFRDYDSRTGRYLESDPIGLRGGLNAYGYVGGNPVSRTDSLGLFFDSVTSACLHDPAFCIEIGAIMIENHGALSGDACTQQAADQVARRLRGLERYANGIQLALGVYALGRLAVGAVAAVAPALESVAAPGLERVAARGMQSVGAAVNRTISIPMKQLEKKFAAHAGDFGVTLPRGRGGFEAMQRAIESHVADPATLAIPGTLRWTEEVTHFFNPNTGLLVIRDGEGVYRSGWRLDPDQIRRLTESGNVW